MDGEKEWSGLFDSWQIMPKKTKKKLYKEMKNIKFKATRVILKN